MEEQRDRAYLESLTSDELVKLADNNGIDIPPGLDRAIIIEELLEALSENDAEETDPVPLVEKSQPASAPIPKQYNITFIEVLIRDPLWAFAFWEIKTHDKDLYEKDPDFNGYFLKGSPCLGSEGSFTIPVGTEDSAWYLGFPPGGGTFKVELLAVLGEVTEVLAISNRFRLPKLLGVQLPGTLAQDASQEKEPQGAPSGAAPLLQLSGIDDLTILRNNQRLSRLPKRGGFQGSR
jgi:hypothetical protein